MRAELTARRDAAAVALAFEFAGRLQAELEALDWITGEQKVSRAPWGQDDADVYGWAGGVLVEFEIRGGRMSGWRQRPCGAAAAGRHLARTPACLGRFRLPQCRTGGSPQVVRWVKLNQLPESSRRIASTPCARSLSTSRWPSARRSASPHRHAPVSQVLRRS